MTNLVTQPYRRPARTPEDNYLVTLAKTIDLPKAVEAAGETINVDLADYLAAHPDGKARIWATNHSGPGTRAWQKMRAGDLVVFFGNGEVYAYGTVASKVLWTNNNHIWPSGENWDFIYSLKDFHELPEGQRLEYQSLRQLTGKLDVQSVGCRDLDVLGVTPEFAKEFVAEAGPRKAAREVKAQATPLRGIESPPKIGERFRNRDVIYANFGGDSQSGIVKFVGESYTNVFSHGQGPYADEVDPETGVIAYRGQGLTGDQSMTRGNKTLKDSMDNALPIRYWNGPKGGPFTFEMWVVITDLDTVREADENGELANRYIWFMSPVGSADPKDWPELPSRTVDALPESPDLPEVIDIEYLKQNYASLCDRLGDPLEPATEVHAPPRKVRRRRKAVRTIVLARAQGMCENPDCTGMPCDVGANGQPLLEVDHLDDLAKNGADHPLNASALCPNCHRAKTYGVNREMLKRNLKRIVKSRHNEFLNRDITKG
jgi:5-methylcytosine-specific restriction protein A